MALFQQTQQWLRHYGVADPVRRNDKNALWRHTYFYTLECNALAELDRQHFIKIGMFYCNGTHPASFSDRRKRNTYASPLN